MGTMRSKAKRITQLANDIRVEANIARHDEGNDRNALYRTELVANALVELAQSIYLDDAIKRIKKVRA